MSCSPLSFVLSLLWFIDTCTGKIWVFNLSISKHLISYRYHEMNNCRQFYRNCSWKRICKIWVICLHNAKVSYRDHWHGVWDRWSPIDSDQTGGVLVSVQVRGQGSRGREGGLLAELVGERKERLVAGIEQFIAVHKLENAQLTWFLREITGNHGVVHK